MAHATLAHVGAMKVRELLCALVAMAVPCGCGGTNFTAAHDGGPIETDATRSDATPSEASDGSVADAGPWCSTQDAAFCADFDESADINTILGGWTSTSMVHGMFDLDTGMGLPSAPNALRVTTNATSGVEAIAAKQISSFPTPLQHMRLEFDLRVDMAGPIDGLAAAGFAAIALGPGLDHGVMALAIGNGPVLEGAYVQPASADAGLASFKAQPSPSSFPNTGAWDGRFAVDVTYGSTNCLQVYQGKMALLASCIQLPPSLLNPTDLWIDLGVSSDGLGNTGTVVLGFDNVTFVVN